MIKLHFTSCLGTQLQFLLKNEYNLKFPNMKVIYEKFLQHSKKVNMNIPL